MAGVARVACQGVKAGPGILFIAIGALVVTGLDRSIEAARVNASPQWLLHYDPLLIRRMRQTRNL